MGRNETFAEMKELLSGTKAAMVLADEPVALRLKYTGKGTVTTVTVDTDQDITLVTSDGGTEEFLLATYTTMGALVDAINASEYWSAEILDALRADSTGSSPFVDNAALTITTDGYYDALVDTSVYKALTFRCKYNRGVNKGEHNNHRVKLVEFDYYATLGAAAANRVRIYEFDRANNVETQIYQATSVSATVTTVNFASGKGTTTAGDNNDLIVRLQDGTSLADSGAYLQVRYIRE